MLRLRAIAIKILQSLGWRATIALLLLSIPVVSSSAPPYQYYSENSVTENGTTVTFTDKETGLPFSATTVWVRNRSTSANEVYISATTYTVTANTTYMSLDPGEWTTLPSVYSDFEPGRTSIGLRCSTGETATVQVWGLR